MVIKENKHIFFFFWFSGIYLELKAATEEFDFLLNWFCNVTNGAMPTKPY